MWQPCARVAACRRHVDCRSAGTAVDGIDGGAGALDPVELHVFIFMNTYGAGFVKIIEKYPYNNNRAEYARKYITKRTWSGQVSTYILSSSTATSEIYII